MASRLCFSGHTTRIEYIGGSRLPPGDIILMAEGVSKDSLSLDWDFSESERLERASFGRASWMSEGCERLMSGTYEEADDRSDLLLTVRIEGLELPEEAKASGDATNDDPADCGSVIGDVFGLGGSESVFDNVGTWLMIGVGEMGDMGVGGNKDAPGVGGGGWSSEDGRLVLM